MNRRSFVAGSLSALALARMGHALENSLPDQAPCKYAFSSKILAN